MYITYIKVMMVASPPFLYLFYRNRLASWHSFPESTHIKVNNALKLAIFYLIELTFFRTYLKLKLHIWFYSNGLDIWQGLSYIRYIKANYGRQSADLNLIELKFIRADTSMKPHISFYGNGLATCIWHDMSDIYPYLKPHILFYCNGLAI